VDEGAIDPAKSARKLSGWGVGLNWSLTRNVKQMADFDHVSFEGGASGGDREPEKVFLVRTQFSF
jgi:phosphate-selective porin OprO/OprP